MSHTLRAPLAAYPYVQYNDDADIVAFFTAFNGIAQGYIDFFNDYNLADYHSPLLTGDLLDWCVAGIYGVERPFLVIGDEGNTFGPYGTTPYGYDVPYGFFEVETGTGITYSYVSDDVYRKVVDWQFYKGDGLNFSIPWLKRRVRRFLTGETWPEETFDVSVSFPLPGQVQIVIPAGTFSDAFVGLVRARAINLPFQYSYSVVVI